MGLQPVVSDDATLFQGALNLGIQLASIIVWPGTVVLMGDHRPAIPVASGCDLTKVISPGPHHRTLRWILAGCWSLDPVGRAVGRPCALRGSASCADPIPMGTGLLYAMPIVASNEGCQAVGSSAFVACPMMAL